MLEERSSGSKKNGSASPSSLDEPLERIKGVLDVSDAFSLLVLLAESCIIACCVAIILAFWTGASLCTCSSQWWSQLEIKGKEGMDF